MSAFRIKQMADASLKVRFYRLKIRVSCFSFGRRINSIMIYLHVYGKIHHQDTLHPKFRAKIFSAKCS